MWSQRPRQSLTRPLNELNAALWPAFIPLRKSQGPVKSRPNCPAVYPEGVQVVPWYSEEKFAFHGVPGEGPGGTGPDPPCRYPLYLRSVPP